MYSRLVAGCGYLGLRAATKWQADGCTVTAITRSPDRATEFQAVGLRPLVMNLSSPQPADSLPSADSVLWAVGMDRSIEVSRQKIWIDGLRWLVQSLPDPPKRFIYVSSTSVYGSADGQEIDETSPTNPTTEGGQCCMQAEQLVRTECSRLFSSTQVVVLRMAGIYGPDRLLRRVDDLKNKTPLPGDADQWLNLIHVDDAVRMVDHVSTTEEDVPPVINVVNSESVTRQEYYSQLAELASAPAPEFGGSTSARSRSGNKKVTSQFCGSVNFEFNDVLLGLRNAWSRTSTPS